MRLVNLTVLVLAMAVRAAPVSAQHDGGRAPVAPDAATHESSGHEGEHGEKPALLEWDFGSAIWSIIVFVIVLVILRMTAWKPILTALQKREQFITGSLAEARHDRDEAKRMMAEHARKMEQAQGEASAIIEEGRRDAEVLRRKLHEETNKEVQEMLARAQRDIKTAQEAAIAEIYGRTLDLATTVAGKIVRKQLTPTDHRALLDESIAELGKAHN